MLPAPFEFKTDQPKAELFRALQARMGRVLNHRYELQQSGLSASNLQALARLDQMRGVAASIMPQTVIIKIQGRGLLTLLSNSAYSNLSSLFRSESRRLPEEDTLTIGNGVLGAYPNIFLQVSETEIPELVSRIEGIHNEGDYTALLDRFGIRRTDPRFWQVSDEVLANYTSTELISHGVLDYNRYENR